MSIGEKEKKLTYQRVDSEFSEAEGYIEAILDSDKLQDTTFIESVQKQMEDKGFVSEKQITALQNIIKNFHIEV